MILKRLEITESAKPARELLSKVMRTHQGIYGALGNARYIYAIHLKANDLAAVFMKPIAEVPSGFEPLWKLLQSSA